MGDFDQFAEAREVVRTIELVSKGGGTFRIEITNEIRGAVAGFAARYYEQRSASAPKKNVDAAKTWVAIDAAWVHAPTVEGALAQATGFLAMWVDQHHKRGG